MKIFHSYFTASAKM